jgi:hypothetical protein
MRKSRMKREPGQAEVREWLAEFRNNLALSAGCRTGVRPRPAPGGIAVTPGGSPAPATDKFLKTSGRGLIRRSAR